MHIFPPRESRPLVVIFNLLCAGLVSGMILLGGWQWGRWRQEQIALAAAARSAFYALQQERDQARQDLDAYRRTVAQTLADCAPRRRR